MAADLVKTQNDIRYQSTQCSSHPYPHELFHRDHWMLISSPTGRPHCPISVYGFINSMTVFLQVVFISVRLPQHFDAKGRIHQSGHSVVNQSMEQMPDKDQ